MKAKEIRIKAIAVCLTALFFSCVKTPSACFSADATNENIKVGQTVKFNADCSQLATEYVWTVDSTSAGNYVKKLYTNQGKEFAYTFATKGMMRVTLTVSRNRNKNRSTARVYQVK